MCKAVNALTVLGGSRATSPQHNQSRIGLASPHIIQGDHNFGGKIQVFFNDFQRTFSSKVSPHQRVFTVSYKND